MATQPDINSIIYDMELNFEIASEQEEPIEELYAQYVFYDGYIAGLHYAKFVNAKQHGLLRTAFKRLSKKYNVSYLTF